MRSIRVALSTAVLSLSLLAAPQRARAEECKCLSVAADVVGALQAEVARADSLYVHGDFDGAYAIYARAAASAQVPSLIYAQAMAKWRLGAAQDARALFSAYLESGGALAYRAQAEAALGELGGRVPTGGVVGGVVGGVTGKARGTVGGVVGGVVGVGGATTGAAVGVTGDVVGGVTGTLDVDKPKKLVPRGAVIVLGVVAVAALGAVGIHAIAAGIKDDIELDAKFDLGLSLSGVAVGATAIYLGGLTAAVGGAGSLRCAVLPPKTPVVAPLALPGGGGVVTAMSF